MKQTKKVNLAFLPTPLHRLPNLSSKLGVDLWTKRDDLTGLAFGGNKTRKLQWLVRDAQDAGASALITTGAPQSNHCRQTAAAARLAGMKCSLVVGGNGPRDWTGNILLDRILGADIHWVNGGCRYSVMDTVADKVRSEGGVPYLIPLGGSNALGAAAYIEATYELASQAEGTFDFIVFATSSGGTQTGIAAGVRQLDWPTCVLGISVEHSAEVVRKKVRDLWDESFEVWGHAPTSVGPIHVNDSFLGLGYAKPAAAEYEAIRIFAQEEGLILDPVYTGRAAAGLMDLVRTGKIQSGSRVLFWHTGGTPALFAYADSIAEYYQVQAP